MHPEKYKNSHELKQEISVEPPVVESFLDPVKAAMVWPESVANNEVFLEQIKARKEMNDILCDVLDCLPRPDISLEKAIEERHITEERAAKLYNSLSDLLEPSQDYRRIIFYLPFEFLPNKAWHPSGEELRKSSARFRKAYMKAWKSLLSVHDIRANFVDGDVLEPEQRFEDLPRVVKAAHLIPKLVENGLMEVEDVIAIIEKSGDEILRNSIADALSVLGDLGLITKKTSNLMKKSDDWLIRNMERIISFNDGAKKQPFQEASGPITVSSVGERLDKEFSAIDKKEYGDITEKRKSWLKEIKRKEVVDCLAKDVGAAVIENNFTDESAAIFLAPEENAAIRQVLVEGIREAIESAALFDIEKARALYDKHKDILMTLWKNNDPEVKTALLKAFRRLHKVGVVDDGQLAELNIVIPKLAGPFSENLKYMEEEISDIRDIVLSIESNPELSQLIYPVVILYGSGLKGYGERNADIDVGVLVRPETSFSNRVKLRELLKEIFAHEKIGGETIEFWLEEKEGELYVYDVDDLDKSFGASYWAHILFGAAWEGNKDVMRELREKLLVPYMRDTGKVIYGHDARSLYLEELERDTLQYRLMHKGYERFFPAYGGIHTPHSDEIDGESMFWDSGYRQLATRLFMSRVFLPKILAS